MIQIVEDDRALGEGIVLALKEPGMEFVCHGSVKEALAAFERVLPGRGDGAYPGSGRLYD